MKARGTLWLVIALLAVLSLITAQCGPTPEPETVVVKETVIVAGTPEVVEKVVTQEVEKVVTEVVEKVVTVEVEKEEPVSPEAQARAETLNIAISRPYSDPTNLNVYAGADRSRSGIHQLVYEYFFYQNLQTGEYIPWLAEDTSTTTTLLPSPCPCGTGSSGATGSRSPRRMSSLPTTRSWQPRP